jgi:hypothetical protein
MTSAKIRPLKVVVLQEKEEKTVSIYIIFRRIASKQLHLNISKILAHLKKIMFS